MRRVSPASALADGGPCFANIRGPPADVRFSTTHAGLRHGDPARLGRDYPTLIGDLTLERIPIRGHLLERIRIGPRVNLGQQFALFHELVVFT